MVDTVEHIEADELNELLGDNRNRPILINTLGREAYKAKRIPGSVNVPTDDIEEITRLAPDKKQPIVVYCANADCEASLQAAEALIDMGYTRVWDFEEGLAGWRSAGLPLDGSEAG
ncbi:MAG: rhodanese-like domain-containing protein [Balneolaceae bacterium]|nr:rhodanese-like domain-containing protein [Balneolaceae bacterium]